MATAKAEAKNVYAVTYQLETVHSKKNEKGESVVVRRGHAGEFTESVIASSPEKATAYVRSKHTSPSQNVLRASAHVVLANVDQIPVAKESEAAAEGEDSAVDPVVDEIDA